RALQNERLASLLQWKTSAALGPGISTNEETVQFVHDAVEKINVPLVLDADGLNAFAGLANWLDGSKRGLVLTPPSGELARLMEVKREDIERKRIDSARELAAKQRLIVVLKGHPTLVAMPDGSCYANPTGNPGMATAGAGDILTGLISGLIAQ